MATSKLTCIRLPHTVLFFVSTKGKLPTCTITHGYEEAMRCLEGLRADVTKDEYLAAQRQITQNGVYPPLVRHDAMPNYEVPKGLVTRLRAWVELAVTTSILRDKSCRAILRDSISLVQRVPINVAIGDSATMLHAILCVVIDSTNRPRGFIVESAAHADALRTGCLGMLSHDTSCRNLEEDLSHLPQGGTGKGYELPWHLVERILVGDAAQTQKMAHEAVGATLQ